MTLLISALVYVVMAIVWQIAKDQRGLGVGPAALILAGVACLALAAVVAAAPRLLALIP